MRRWGLLHPQEQQEIQIWFNCYIYLLWGDDQGYKKATTKVMLKFGLGWIQFLCHHTFYIKVLQYQRYQSVFISSQWPPWEYLASVVYEIGGCRTELRAAGQKMATGAMRPVANEQQNIIFKWALKINCVVLLTLSLSKSPKSCMVNFKRLHSTAVQLVFDEHWVFW